MPLSISSYSSRDSRLPAARAGGSIRRGGLRNREIRVRRFWELKAELHFFEERVRTDPSMFPLFRTGGKVRKSTVHPRLIHAYEAREGYVFVVDAWDTHQDR